MRKLTGSTSDGQEIARREQASDAPFLNAGFWEKGTTMICEVLTVHKSSNGPYVSVGMVAPPFVEMADAEGELHENTVVRIGNLAGVSLARRAALKNEKNKYFAVGDLVQLTCTGITPPKKEGYSPSPNFEIVIQRAEEAPPAKEKVPF